MFFFHEIIPKQHFPVISCLIKILFEIMKLNIIHFLITTLIFVDVVVGVVVVVVVVVVLSNLLVCLH